MFKFIKNQIKEARVYKKAKRFLKQLVGQDIRFKAQVKQANTLRFGDWCIEPTGLNEDSVIYSLGVGEDIEFDVGMMDKYGVNIHAFDPTPNTIKWVESKELSDKFIFHPYGISNIDEKIKIFPRVNKRGKKSNTMFSVVEEDNVKNHGIEVQMHTLKTIMQELGHTKIDILKMDIEASEYSVIADIVNTEIEVDQILVEFHHRFKSISNNMTLEAIDMLNRKGYKIFFISELGREYSFIKK